MKKITMKDIAREANVSVATVSYVLNNVENQTIPEKTRCQIMQLVKELNYIPNLAARSLSKKKTGLVGVLINTSANMPFWKRHNYFSFIESLERRLTKAGYHTLLYTLDSDHPSLDIIVERKLEAVFLIDVKDDVFYSISAHFIEGVPLILIDSLIEDKLFKQVLFDYHSVLQAALPEGPAQTCLIMESYNNSALSLAIMADIPLPKEAIFIIHDLDELNAVLHRNTYKKAIVINEFMGNHIEKAGVFEHISVICTCSCPEILGEITHKIVFKEDKAAAAFALMEDLLQNVDYSVQTINRYYIK